MKHTLHHHHHHQIKGNTGNGVESKSDREAKLEARIEKLERLLAAMSLLQGTESPTTTLRGTALINSPTLYDDEHEDPLMQGSYKEQQNRSHARTLLATMEQNHERKSVVETYHNMEQEVRLNMESSSNRHHQESSRNYYDALSLSGIDGDDSSVEIKSHGNNIRRNGHVHAQHNQDSSSRIDRVPSHVHGYLGRPPVHMQKSLTTNIIDDCSNSVSMMKSPQRSGVRMGSANTESESSADVGAGLSSVNINAAHRRPRLPSDASNASGSGIGRVMASPAMKPVSTVLDYVKEGMTNRHKEGKAEHDSDILIQEFLSVPFRVEGLLMFGLLVCVDCFLYVLTFLPLKFFWSIVCVVQTIFNAPLGRKGMRFHRRHFYHVVQIAVIVVVSYMLNQVSIGRLYHWIRVQAMIKLYVIVAMIDVFDRLLVSFGKDAIDSLYWNINRRPYHPRCIASILVVLCYTALHALLLFVHAASVNVAMNSADAALLSLLVSGNFAEIKSTVFKKYQKKNLFDITAGDINERFKLFLFLFLIFVLNICQGSKAHMISDFAYVGSIVFCSEIVADWIKHCFITKMNFIKSDVYLEYGHTICMDITGKGDPDGINMDHTHNVVRRIGMAQIPLACVLVRYLNEAAKYSSSLLEISNTEVLALVVALFTILFVLKIFLGIVIINLAAWNLGDVSENKNGEEYIVGKTYNMPKPIFGKSVSLQQLFHGSGRGKQHRE